jgi:predicted ATPase/class 3 adenylate cyclase/DNA-binding CsgD family transcriptional regulator
MARLPEGTTTFMLTDLESSTRAWESQPKAMRAAMARHDAILAATVRDHMGELVEPGREGDSVLAVFRTAATAALCALDIQKKFGTESWPEELALKMRIAMHTGEAQLREGHYFGAALNRCARLLTICHPGQILLTKATEALLVDEVPAGSDIEDLGLHRLKDLARPEQVFQLSDLASPSEFPGIKSITPQQTNIPRYLTNFVGRDVELASLRSLLLESRLLTLTGAGGSGKTRLAAELGRAFVDLWPGGVWWVELASVSDPLQVPAAVVAALELPGRGPAMNVATAWLAPRRALLILDSCEHLVGACADFCLASLQKCQELTILTTSREAMGVPGESRWPVASMASNEAVQLFELRAHQLVPEFNVTSSNIDTITQICERLDGMPLGIELASARLSMMTEQEVLSQLSDRFRLLTGGSRTAPQRQQTMIATIDWSYRLLNEEEALLFRRLAVFRGGFTFESAQAICSDDFGSVLDPLTGLVLKSMVVADRAEHSGTRYRLLESQLAYAEDGLRAGGELVAMRRRHYEYYRKALSDRSSDRLTVMLAGLGVAEADWKARELSNLWAAMEWARTYAADLGLSFAVDLSIIPQVDATQARRLLADVLDHSPEKGASRAIALIRASGLAQIQGDSVSGVTTVAAGLALARELGDPELVAHALLRAGSLHAFNGELQTAAEEYEEAISVINASGNRRLLTPIQNNMAILAMERGDFSLACIILVKCVAAARADGDVVLYANYLDSLAAAQLGVGDKEAASAGFKEALSSYRSLHFHRGVITCLQGLSRVASADGDDEPAVRLAAAASRMSRDLSLMDDAWASRFTEESLRRSQSKLGKRQSDDAWKLGWAMTMDQAIDYALGESKQDTAVDAGPLSRRQREVAMLVAAGLTNREIAERLFIAERSAEGHVERIRNKLGVRSRTEVATWAVEHGLTARPIKEKGTRDGPLPTRRGQPL